MKQFDSSIAGLGQAVAHITRLPVGLGSEQTGARVVPDDELMIHWSASKG